MGVALLTGLLTACIATPVFRWHYKKIYGQSLNRRSSWVYACVVGMVTTVIAYLTIVFLA